MSFACFSACFALSAALFSSLALPPLGLFFSCLLLGFASNSFLGAIVGGGRGERGEERRRRTAEAEREATREMGREGGEEDAGGGEQRQAVQWTEGGAV